MIEYKGSSYHCSMEFTLSLIGGKWKCLIIWYLGENTLRFCELKRKLPGVTQRMLTLQLRELENDGIVNRKIFVQVPPKVEYSLTDAGKALIPVLLKLSDWALDFYHTDALKVSDNRQPGSLLGNP